MIAVSDIVVDDFKTLFKRDFTYAIAIGATTSSFPCDMQKEMILDEDIERAFLEATINFNEALFSDSAQLKLMFLYLAAHYLVYDLTTSKQSFGSGSSYPVSSRSIGGVSESYMVPAWVSEDPVLGSFATTRYGVKYISLLKPLLIGNVQVYEGATTPW
jgi:hypothetical protein